MRDLVQGRFLVLLSSSILDAEERSCKFFGSSNDLLEDSGSTYCFPCKIQVCQGIIKGRLASARLLLLLEACQKRECVVRDQKVSLEKCVGLQARTLLSQD